MIETVSLWATSPRPSTGGFNIANVGRSRLVATILEPVNGVYILYKGIASRVVSFSAISSFDPSAAVDVDYTGCRRMAMFCDLSTGIDRNPPQQQFIALESHLCRH